MKEGGRKMRHGMCRNIRKARRMTMPSSIRAIAWLLFLSCANPLMASELPSIAVMNFTSTRPTKIAEQFPELLSNVLVNSGRFSVLERSKLNKVLEEQSLGGSGFVDPKTAVAFGNLTGSQYLVVGNVNDFSAEQQRFQGYGISTATTIYRTNISVKILETKSGRVVFSTIKDAQEKVMQATGVHIRDGSIESKLAQAAAGKIMEEIEKSNLVKESAGGPAAEISKVRVKVLSSPSHADVEVDGIFYGNAAGEIELPAGLHGVRISLAGHEEWRKKVNIQTGTTIKATLLRKR
jgi:curli biogenesis system outer membrane secretion channel CsgG